MTKPTSPPVFAGRYWNQAAEIDAALQAEGAVFRVKLPNQVAVWMVTRYEEARAALTDPRLSKESCLLESLLTEQLEVTGQTPDLSWMFSPHMLFRDGKAHDRLRGLVLSQFGHARVQALQPRMEQVTAGLLAGMPSGDAPVDLISKFAYPLPLSLIGDLLGIPEPDRPALRRWTTQMMQDRQEVTVPASREMAAYLRELIATRRRTPGDDLLSALVTAEVDGDRLSEREVMGSAFLMIVAGHETTTNLLGNAVRWLLEQPEVWRRLGSEPALLAGVIEEVLRFDSPVRLATHRCTIAPVLFGGVSIPAGEIVMISLAAANRDPRRFADPDRLVWDRASSDARGHLAFGHGLHHCLGAMMARAEVEIGLAQLSDRFPHARLAVPAEQLDRQESAIMNGFQALPVLLGPATQR